MQPQVVAHRGSSAEEPEHTLKAYLLAIEVGADALECDVRMTADGHLVCVHDRRVNRTSNGQGRVSTLELAELEKLDWGSWKTDWADALDAETPDRNRGELLTLRALLTAVAAADRRVDLAIETKHPTRYAGQVERKLRARSGATAGLPTGPLETRRQTPQARDGRARVRIGRRPPGRPRERPRCEP